MTYPELSQKLLSRIDKLGGVEGLEKACAIWLLDEKAWQDLQPYYLPTKPQAVVDFDNLPDDKKEKLTAQYFAEHPTGIAVVEYVSKLRHSLYYNQQKLYWLKVFRDRVDKEEQRQKYDEKIAEFLEQERRCWEENFNYLPAQFRRVLVRQEAEQDSTAQAVVDMFGGTVE